MDSSLLLHRLGRVFGWTPPDIRRSQAAARIPVEVGEGDAPDAIAAWCAARGIEYPAAVSADPFEDAEEYVQVLSAFADYQALVVDKARERLASVAGDSAKVGAARRTLAREQELEDYADGELSKLWGETRSTRPFVRGPRDPLDDLTSISCSCGCGRRFRDAGAKAAALGLHPFHVEERRRLAGEAKPQSYAGELAERLGAEPVIGNRIAIVGSPFGRDV